MQALRARLEQEREGEPRRDGIAWSKLPALSCPLCSSDLLPRAEVATGLVGTMKAGRARTGCRPGRQLLRMGLQRAASDFAGGSGLLTLCSPRMVNGAAQLRSCPPPACPSQEPALPCTKPAAW